LVVRKAAMAGQRRNHSDWAIGCSASVKATFTNSSSWPASDGACGSAFPISSLTRRVVPAGAVDDLATVQHVGGRLGRRGDVAEVGLMIAGERRGTVITYASACGISC
jgi:hypothetical protein